MLTTRENKLTVEDKRLTVEERRLTIEERRITLPENRRTIREKPAETVQKRNLQVRRTYSRSFPERYDNREWASISTDSNRRDSGIGTEIRQ